MELVSTSKLQKVKRNFESSKEYFNLVVDTYQKVLNAIPDFKKILPLNDDKPNLYLVITSDYGLCGAYNSNVLKLVAKEIKPNDELIVIGLKGLNYFKSLQYKITFSIDNIGDTIYYRQLSNLINLISSKFVTNEIKNIIIASTKYLNSISFAANLEEVIKFDQPNTKSQVNSFEFEPNPKIVLFKTLPLYIGAIIYGKVVEAKVVETAMRRISMESATDNADDLIDNLSIKYNQARQSLITQEIAEIVSGSESGGE